MMVGCIETGIGIKHTRFILNKELQKDDCTKVGFSCVKKSYLLLIHVTIKIRKVLMGTNNAPSPWAKVSFNIYKQLAICSDQLDLCVTKNPPMPESLAPIEFDIIASVVATAPSPPLAATTTTDIEHGTEAIVVAVAPSIPLDTTTDIEPGPEVIVVAAPSIPPTVTTITDIEPGTESIVVSPSLPPTHFYYYN